MDEDEPTPTPGPTVTPPCWVRRLGGRGGGLLARLGSGGLGGGLVSRRMLSVLWEPRIGFTLCCSRLSRSLGVSAMSGREVRCATTADSAAETLMLATDPMPMPVPGPPLPTVMPGEAVTAPMISAAAPIPPRPAPPYRKVH